MKTSKAGRDLIERFEGLRLQAYQDAAGIWTIGYGHTGLSGGPSRVKEGDVCTSAQADEWLEVDIGQAERAINAVVKIPLSQNQFDALVAFVFNIGWAAFEGSTLLRLLNSGNPGLASAQFLKWDYVDGHQNEGLLRRRLAERALFDGQSPV